MAQAFKTLQPGDRVPSFKARTKTNPQFTFDSMGGRWIVLGFVPSAGGDLAPAVRRAMAETLFDDAHACLFMVTPDPEDEATGRLQDVVPGRRVFRDDDSAVSRLYGAVAFGAGALEEPRPMWMVIDPALTLRHIVPMQGDAGCIERVIGLVRDAPPPAQFMGFAVPPPILILPDVFEPDFCDHLIALYKADGGTQSGFMRDEGGRTVAKMDPSFKVRSDYTLTDPDLIKATQARVMRKVIPQIARVHFFQCTRMERYMVGCYPADEGGHFKPHRDNTTLGTAHRRFAVSINLNDDFEGGAVSFPEYSPQGFKAPRGTAVIFSCSMLHAVSKVTSGTRFAFLPFLYDDAAARLREANAARVPNSAGYRA